MNPYEIMYDGETSIVITYNNDVIYTIDLERCNSAAEILDWIYQVMKQSWYKPFMADMLLSEFNRAANITVDGNIQSLFCPNGKTVTFNWMKQYNYVLLQETIEEEL